jgi:hypothetical protein
MKVAILIIAAILVLAAVGGLYLKRKLSAMAEGAKIVIVIQRLGQAATELRKHGAFTNDVPNLCDIYTFTNQITLGGTPHQCVLAAKSPSFQENGFMVITTNDTVVWIDRDGKARALSGPDSIAQ